jgi:hypothetical protein
MHHSSPVFVAGLWLHPHNSPKRRCLFGISSSEVDQSNAWRKNHGHTKPECALGPVWRTHKFWPPLSRNTSLHILLATSPNTSKRTLSIANSSPWRLAIFTSSPPSRSLAVACSASVGPYYRLGVTIRLTELRYQFHECNVCCVLDVVTEAAILTDAHSLGTWQYKCYFNQGPNYPTAADPHHCSGPRASVQGGITASMPGASFVGALISGFL